MIRRVGVVCLLALLGAFALGGGASPARAATPSPTLKIEVIGQGKVTGTGINCGLGRLSCYATYADTTPIALTASPANSATGWHFDHWEDDAGTVCPGTPGANPCSVAPASAGATATAVFDPPSGVIQTANYGVAVSAGGVNGTVTNGSTNYPIDCGDAPHTTCTLSTYSGSTITVVESPDAGFFFGGWGGSCSSAAPSCATYLSGDQTASATFTASTTNALNVTVTGDGTVSGGGIICGSGSTCDAQEPPNVNVTLTARPASGYGFAGWGNACSGTQATCTVQMDVTRTVTADFEPLVPFSLTVSGNGTVSGAGVTCGPGPQTCSGTTDPEQTLTFTASPSTGATVFWSGCSSSAGNICSVNVTTNAVSVTATFSGGTTPPVSTYALTLSVTGDGYVTSALNSSVHCTAAGGAGCTVNLNQNTTVTLTAVPASGASTDFTPGWSGACASFFSTTCTLTMTGPKSVGAAFAGDNTTYVLTGQVTGLGTIVGGGLNCTSSGGAGCTVPQAAGAGITLTATPSFGATFTGWSGACSGTSPTCAVSMTNAKNVTAAFQTSGGGTTAETVALTVAGGGSVSGLGVACSNTATTGRLCTIQATHGQAMTLTAKAAPGYVFTGWTGACSGKKTTCQVTVNTPLTIGAVFERPALASTHTPTVAGNRVTLSYRSRFAGTMKLVATRSGKTVGLRTGKVTVGTHKVVMTMPGKGRYVVTLTVKSKAGAHSIRWRVTIK